MHQKKQFFKSTDQEKTKKPFCGKSKEEIELKIKQEEMMAKKMDIFRIAEQLDRMSSALSVVIFKMPDGKKIIEQTKQLNDFN